MMSTEIDKSIFENALGLAGESLEEVAMTALDLDASGPRSSRNESSLAQLGAYVPLILDGVTIGVGVKSSEDGCTSLACALMMMDEPEDLTQDDVADAVGEIANLLAGGVKARLNDQYDDVKLGTPLILHGHIHSSSRQQLIAADYTVGPADVELLVLTNHAQ